MGGYIGLSVSSNVVCSAQSFVSAWSLYVHGGLNQTEESQRLYRLGSGTT